jgi:tetratricopeptide (TPR) repeat protein
MYQRALNGREKVLGLDHISTLDTVHNLGLLYANQGKLKEAEEVHLRALEGCGKAIGLDHTACIERIQKDLSVLYRNQGRLEEGENMLIQALVDLILTPLEG